MKMLIAAFATTVAAPLAAATYTPINNGGTNTGVFQYGYDAGMGFQAWTSADYHAAGTCPYITATACYAGGTSFLGTYFAPSDGNYQGANLSASEVTFHPGPGIERSGLQFVAPTAGTYRFSGYFRAADQPNGNGIVFTTPDGTDTLGVRPAQTPFSFTQTLTAGGRATFLVGNNGSYGFDTTGVSLSVTAVPEPASWAMMILGLGLVGGAARYRRRGIRVAFAG